MVSDCCCFLLNSLPVPASQLSCNSQNSPTMCQSVKTHPATRTQLNRHAACKQLFRWEITTLFGTVHPLKCYQTFTDPFITLQGPTAASQQMDDLFDVLIESGGKKYCRNSGGNW